MQKPLHHQGCGTWWQETWEYTLQEITVFLLQRNFVASKLHVCFFTVRLQNWENIVNSCVFLLPKHQVFVHVALRFALFHICFKEGTSETRTPQKDTQEDTRTDAQRHFCNKFLWKTLGDFTSTIGNWNSRANFRTLNLCGSYHSKGLCRRSDSLPCLTGL